MEIVEMEMEMIVVIDDCSMMENNVYDLDNEDVMMEMMIEIVMMEMENVMMEILFCLLLLCLPEVLY
jgi:hypothetical protein